MELSLIPTMVLLTAGALFTAFSGFMGQRPPDPKRGPRMVPWRLLMLLTFTVSLFLLVHVLTLVGLKTDQPMRY